MGGADSDNAAVMLDLQFDYYDGGRHYCRMCDDTSNTIIHFLTHLHSTKHREVRQLMIEKKCLIEENILIFDEHVHYFDVSEFCVSGYGNTFQC